MRYDLFSIPILVDDLDITKLKINDSNTHTQFGSEIESSHGLSNNIDKDCIDYFFKIIVKNLNEIISKPYIVKLDHIWKNYYKPGDFQEKHIHSGSDFSFIIYESVDSDTVFVHPVHYLIKEKYKNKNIFETQYSIKNKIGKIIIFPSFLEHYVKKQKSSGVTISGNLQVTFKEENL